MRNPKSEVGSPKQIRNLDADPPPDPSVSLHPSPKKGRCQSALLSLCLVLAFGVTAIADTFYVDVNSTNAIAPYTNWATAATTIQDAVNVATNGDLVYVASGIYSNGFGVNAPVVGNSNRVSITKPITVRSSSGPENTIIVGQGLPDATGVRCAYLTNGAVLSGFTLRQGASHHFWVNAGGGGAFLDKGGVVENCIVENCRSSLGAGVFLSQGGTLTGSTVVSNTGNLGAGAYLFKGGGRILNSMLGCNQAGNGGGAYAHQGGSLERCTMVSNNVTGSGGGVYLFEGGTAVDCSILGNSSDQHGGGACCDSGGLVSRCRIEQNISEATGAGYGGGLALYSGGVAQSCLVMNNIAKYYGGGAVLYHGGGTAENCTVFGNHTYSPGGGGGGVASLYSGSKTVRNSIIWGNTAAAGAPNWGEYYGSASTNLFEFCCTTPTNSLPGGIGCFEADPLFVATSTNNYRLQEVSPCRNAGTNQPWMPGARDFPGRVRVVDAVVDLGAYEWGPGILHVWTNSPTPVPPYTSWDTAAQAIQDAIDEALAGEMVLVTNGVYSSGGQLAEDSLVTNRIVVDKPITVRSVNGRAHTFIVGQGVGLGGTNHGDGAVRCAWLGSNAHLNGFTLTNGHTISSSSQSVDFSGGGIYASQTAVISNCRIVACSASRGGGVMGGNVFDTLISGNRADGVGGGASYAVLDRCQISENIAGLKGGGVGERSSLHQCLIISNRVTSATSSSGGGVSGPDSALFNSVVVGNSAAMGGGVDLMGPDSGVYHCTVVGNVASERGGGIHGEGVVENSIVYHNTATGDPHSANYCDSTFLEISGSCSYPERPGVIVTNEPGLVDPTAGDFRLRYGSPCIDAAVLPRFGDPHTNDFVGTLRPIDGDFDGVANQDIGAYEYNPATYDTDGDGMVDGWEHGYGLNPTSATDAAENPDADPHSNLEEYLADTNPTNDLSYFRIVALSNLPPWSVYFWPSSTNRFYTLEANTNLTAAAWSHVFGQVRVPGMGGTQSLSDTNQSVQRFYRVGASP